MAEFNFNYPEGAYGIPQGALQSYWRKMRQGGATSGVYVPASARRAEMEGIMDSLAKNASVAAQRRAEQKRWDAEMALKQSQFAAELDEKKSSRNQAAISGLTTPIVNYYTQKNLLNSVYGVNPNADNRPVSKQIGDWISGTTSPIPSTTKQGLPLTDEAADAAFSNAPPPAMTPTRISGGQTGFLPTVQSARSGFGNAISESPYATTIGAGIGTALGNSAAGEKIGKAILFNRGGRNERRGAAGALSGGLSAYAMSGGDPYSAALAALFGGFGSSKGFGLFG